MDTLQPTSRKPYPTDVSDEEWAFAAPYLTLMNEDVPRRLYPLREVFNGLRYVVRGGISWRMIPNDLPPWHAVFERTQRWLAAGVFETMVHDLRIVLRVAAGRKEEPTAAILDSRTLQSTPESGARTGYDGAKRKNGTKVHVAVDTLGHLLALYVTPADEQDRAQVGDLVKQVQQETSASIEIAYVDQGYTGEEPAQAALLSMTLNSLSSSCQRQRRALFSCPDAGSSNAPLPGRLASGAWQRTMNVYLKPLPDSTSLPLPY